MLGYDLKNGVLKIVPEEAELVKRIFNMYLYEKKSLTKIAKELNAEGLVTIKGNEWRATGIRQILTNEKHAGNLTQGVFHTPDYLTKQRVRNKDKSKLISFSNHHEPIINREVWDNVQIEMRKRGTLLQTGSRYSNRNWFSNKIVCGKCGATYGSGGSPEVRPNKRSFKCRNRLMCGKEITTSVTGKQLGCDSKAFNELALLNSMRFILEHIQSSREEIVNDMLDEIKLMQQSDEPFDTKPLEAEIDDNIRKKRKAYDLMLDDKINKEDLIEQSTFYDSEIARLTEEINQAQNLTAVHQTQINKVKAHIAEVNKTAEIETDNVDIYGELLDKIVVNDGNAIVYLKCMPMGFKIFYHTDRTQRIFKVIIDNYEIVG
jgi:hypothetical protein